MGTTTPMLPFDLRIAKAALAAKDERLARLIEETAEFQIEMESMDSPYEALMESIAYQSISGKAAATIFARIKALGKNSRPPTPEEMLKLRPQKLRKAGLSGAKVLAMKDLARKKGWSVTYGKKRMPKPKELVAFGERWRPYRTLASWYMWRAFERAGYKATNKIAKALARRKKAKSQPLPAIKNRKKIRPRSAASKSQ